MEIDVAEGTRNSSTGGKIKSKTRDKGRRKILSHRSSTKREFETFRYHDVGEPGEIQRLAGKRSSGAWADQAWLIGKDMAHIEGDTLVADSSDAQEILDKIGPAKHVKGDIFQGHPRKNVPEREKPTPAQRGAQMENIRKAQKARRK